MNQTNSDPRPCPIAPLPAGISATALQIDRRIAESPNSPAVLSETVCFTYAQLDREVSIVAASLSKVGVRNGDLVAIHAVRSAWLVPVLLGVWRCGAAFVIVDAAHPARRILSCLAQLSLKAVIQTSTGMDVELAAYLEAKSIPILENRERPGPGTLSAGDTAADGEALAYIAFTSGTTGTPRGVLGTHSPVAHFLDWHSQRFKLGANDRFAMLSGLGHDPLLRDILTPLTVGASLSVPTDATLRDARELAAWMRAKAITVAHLTPTLAQMLALGAELDSLQFPDLRYLFTGGEPMPVKLANEVLDLAPKATIVNFYGATETPQAMGYYVYNRASPPKGRTLPVGQGIDGVQLLVVRDTGQLAQIGEVGEICIRTPYLATGYWNDPAATGQRFIVNPFTREPGDRVYRTGDTGTYLGDGAVSFQGRNDKQVKISGYRVELSEIESALEAHPHVRKALVSTAGSRSDDPELAAYFVPAPGVTLDPADVRRFAASVLPKHMVPGKLMSVPSFPMTRNGKIDWSELRHHDSFLTKPFVPLSLRSPLETDLARLWAEALGLDHIRREDHFFDLGGDSLKAARLAAKIEGKLGIRVPLALLLEAPTPAGFARKIEQGDVKAHWSPLVRLAAGVPGVTPLFCVHAVGGNVVTYRDLALRIGDRPLYGLQSIALSGQCASDETIEAMASRYVAEIRRVQPLGPYYLAGFSAGGLIALEMARQLQLVHEKTAAVLLFDTRITSQVSVISTIALKVIRNAREFLRMPGAAKVAFLETKWDNTRMNLNMLAARLSGNRRNANERLHKSPETILRDVEVSIRLAEEKYHPANYDGRVVLFRAHEGTAADPMGITRVWRSVLSGVFETYDVPGSHDTMLLPPHVNQLSELVRGVLDTKDSTQLERFELLDHRLEITDLVH